MTTGAELASITSKKLMGFEDFGSRMLDYLRELNRQVVDFLFEQGTMDNALPLSSPGADQVQVDLFSGKGDVHDGDGHLMDLAQISRVATFENTNLQVYEVGAGFITKPSGIQINPRTGIPEYVKRVEDVGQEADPDSVTDNGNGTITFNLNALLAPNGEDQSGRTVRVFRKTPAAEATSESIAIEELLVAFGGGQNTITTVAALGQTTVSTVASEYTVQLVGITVLRDTGNPVSTSTKLWFAGTVTGNGGTPTVFDITVQNVLDTTILSATGAAQVGVDSSQFTTSVLTGGSASDEGGLAVPGDPDNPTQVQLALENADKRHVARRAFSATFGPTGTLRGDFLGQAALEQVQTINDGGRYLLRDDGGSPYQLTANEELGVPNIAGIPRFPEVVGAAYYGRSLEGDGDEPVVLEAKHATNLQHGLRGRFRRLQFKGDGLGSGGNHWMTGADSAGGANSNGGNAHFEDCQFGWGDLGIVGGATEQLHEPNTFRNCVFGTDSGTGTFSNDEALRIFGGFGAGQPSQWLSFEHCLFKSNAAMAGALATVQIDTFGVGAAGNTTISQMRPIVFRDCIFDPRDAPDAGENTIRINSTNGQPILFENCVILGYAGQTGPLVNYVANSAANIHWRNCYFLAVEGQAIDTRNAGGSMVDCYVRSGTGTGFATHKLIRIDGGRDAEMPFFIENLRVNVQEACADKGSMNGGSIQIGQAPNAANAGNVIVDGLHVIFNGSAFSNEGLIDLWGTASEDTNNPYAAQFTNININLNNKLPSAATVMANLYGGNLEATVVSITGFGSRNTATMARNVVVSNWGNVIPAINDQVPRVLTVKGCSVSGLAMAASDTTASGSLPTTGWKSILAMDNWGADPAQSCVVSDFDINAGQIGLCPDGIIAMQNFSSGGHYKLLNGRVGSKTSGTQQWEAGQSVIVIGSGNQADYSEIGSVTFDIDEASTTPGPVITEGAANRAEHLSIHDCKFDYSGPSQIARLIDLASENVQVVNNQFRVNAPAGPVDTVRLTGDGCMFKGNILQSITANLPTWTNTGTGSIGSAVDNVVSI